MSWFTRNFQRSFKASLKAYPVLKPLSADAGSQNVTGNRSN